MSNRSIPLFCCLAGLFLLHNPRVNAQHTAAEISTYAPEKIFSPDFYSFPGNKMRSAQGTPGPEYWQNRADYQVDARLDTLNNRLSAVETLTYTNNSPDQLPFIWLMLDQQTYGAKARSNFINSNPGADHTNGYTLRSVEVMADGHLYKAAFVITDTRMQIRLLEPLASRGAKLKIRIHYNYQIPAEFGNRTDFTKTAHGKIFEIAQWFPRACVYDDARGWNTLPYLGPGEFYLEYGDINYAVTLPRGMVVAGSGELQNPQDVLTKNEIQRLDIARSSDATVMIRTADEVLHAQPGTGAECTWKFRMLNTRDVAFGASKAYIWDAARINLPEGKKSLAMSVYPVESAGSLAWGRSTEYLKKSIEYFSAQWFTYPYPVAVNEAGTAGGMEYPGILFDGMGDKGKTLFFVTAHEIGHNWFPMIVGSDERRYAWMDEGFNTFIDIYASDIFNKGEYAPKRDGEYAPGGGNPADEVIPFTMDSSLSPIIMTAADAIPEIFRHPVAYFKPAFGLVLLREQILGKIRFDYAFRNYIKAWAYKHPQPNDFFRSMENGAGEDLSWFWKGWFYHNWELDQCIVNASYTKGNAENGLDITIANLKQMVMPVLLRILYADGSRNDISIPVETWLKNKSYTFHAQGSKKVSAVVLDPDHALPDMNRRNNVFTLEK